MAAHTKIVTFVVELRKSIRNLALVLCCCTLGIFFLSPQLLHFVQGHLAEKLYFFSVAGPFLAHVKLALFAALYVLMPWFTVVVWRALGKPFGVSGGQLFFFIFFTCLLFYAGTIFCYYISRSTRRAPVLVSYPFVIQRGPVPINMNDAIYCKSKTVHAHTIRIVAPSCTNTKRR